MSKSIYVWLILVILGLGVIATILLSCGDKSNKVSLFYVNTETFKLVQHDILMEEEVNPSNLLNATFKNNPNEAIYNVLIPDGTVVLGYEINEDNVLELNLSKEFTSVSYGALGDGAMVTSIVNTMVANMPGVASVMFKVEGEPLLLLHRSVYLGDPLGMNTEIIEQI